MNNQSVQQLSPFKVVLFSTILLLACVSLSFVLMKSGLNQAWMLNIHAAPVLPAWFWALINLGGDAWVILLILLLIERFPGEITSWVLKTWLIGALVSLVIKNTLPMPRPASVLGVDNLSIIDHPPLAERINAIGSCIGCHFLCVDCLHCSQTKRRPKWVFVAHCYSGGYSRMGTSGRGGTLAF